MKQQYKRLHFLDVFDITEWRAKMASVVPKPGRNSNWKIAHVIAIFRKGDNSLPSNYRPISLISCVGKIMERVIYKYVFNHLQRNKLIYEYQSGFLPKYSTVHQLLEMYTCFLNSLEKKEISCLFSVMFLKRSTNLGIKGCSTKLNHTV